MKPIKKTKLPKKEYIFQKEIGANLHKKVYTSSGKKIKKTL